MIFRRIIIAIKKVNADNQPVKILSNFLGFGLIGFSIYILISLISYNAADSAYFYQTNDPNVLNLGGPAGAVISDVLLSTIGLGSYLLLLFISLWSLESLAPKIFNLSSPKFLFRVIGGLLSLICFTALCEFYIAGQSFPQGSSGGFLGKSIFSNLVLIFGLIGSLLFLLIFLIPSVTLGLNISWSLLFTYAGKLILKMSSLTRSLLENVFKFLEKLISSSFAGIKNLIGNIKDIQKNKQIESSKSKPVKAPTKKSPEIKAVPKTQSVINLKSDKSEDKVDLSESDMGKDEEPVTKMPSTELLDRALDDGDSLSKEDLESLSELLEIKLDEFGIEAEVVSVLPGPVVTRFEIQPAPGTKANKITNIAQDIARSLAVSSVRVVEVIEGKSVVGIEIPNTNRKMVRLKEILASAAFENSKSHLSLALGKDIAGKAVVVNLEKMPHLLVAGTTGSGKSVGINAMLLSLLFKSDPEDVRLILIDPKMLELSVYDGIPHLLTPVITDMSDAANGLRWCVAEMDRRYKLMSAMGVRNLASFNSTIKDASEKGSIFSNLVLIFGLIGSLLFLLIFLIPSVTLGLNISWSLLFTYAGKLILKMSSLTRSLLENVFKFLEKLISSSFAGIKNLIGNIKDIQKNKQIESSKSKPVKAPTKKSPEIKAVPKTQSVINLKSDKSEDKVDLSESDMGKDEEPVTKMPSTELLDRALDDGDSLSKEDLESLSELLEIKLDEFGIEAEVVSVLPGPVVTRFEIQPAPGTKANKITNIAQDIARSLAVSSVRVVEVIEGKSVVGIEIPNTNRKMVRLKEILASAAFENSKSHLSLALGKDIAGKAVVVNLEKMPHLLVAGTTGSGKSVGINAMLLSLLFKSDPEDVRLILIDPKMLELSVYDGIPHLLTPVITDMSDAANGLRWCVAEMDRRYKLMSAMGVRNLASFNSTIKDASEKGESIQNPLKEDVEDYLEELPSIVVVVDEFADMMMLVGKKVEHLIARIAQKARAAGIHLILATQRPSVDVITGLIKANIPTRISFQVSTKIDSRTVLDQGGAEQLLGYGDMLYLPAGQGVPARVHGAFVGDDEVHRVVDDWKKRGTPDFIDEITSDLQDTGPIPGWSNASGSSGEEDDELYDEAVNFVIESRRASISAVQRKLRIGYNRAARIIESMEAAGLVSEMSSNGSREVLVPKRN